MGNGRRYPNLMKSYGGVRVGAKSGTRVLPSTGHRWKELVAKNLEGVGTILEYGEQGQAVDWRAVGPDLFASHGPDKLRDFAATPLGRVMLGVPFRSKMEHNVARYFEAIRTRVISSPGIFVNNWIYEPCRFGYPNPRGVREYCPDFLVLYHGRPFEFVEVKGYMDKKSKTALHRFEKHYPILYRDHFKLIEGPEYKAIEKKLASIIPGWER